MIFVNISKLLEVTFSIRFVSVQVKRGTPDLTFRMPSQVRRNSNLKPKSTLTLGYGGIIEKPSTSKCCCQSILGHNKLETRTTWMAFPKMISASWRNRPINDSLFIPLFVHRYCLYFRRIRVSLSVKYFQYLATCTDPGQVDNAVRVGTAPFTVGSIVRYNCNNCFQGGGAAVCQDTRIWSTLPICQRNVHYY